MAFQSKYLIYPVNKDVKLVFEPVFPLHVDAQANYSVRVYPLCGVKHYKRKVDASVDVFFEATHALTVCGDALELDVTFPQEDAYEIRLMMGEELLDKLEVYALEEDLFGLTPYKGDNHMHTYFSDGRDTPMYMAANCCRRGYDYCAITDHRKYAPSVLAREFYEPTGVDFLVMPGEEIHSPDNPVHIISLGACESITDWWQEDESEYRAAVEKEMQQVDDTLCAKDRYAVAACQAVFDRIRQAGGVSILCHPHWILGATDAFNQHEDITDYLFEHKKFDVLELIAGGAFEVGTQLQVSYYQEQGKMPIVGSSDAHSAENHRMMLGNYTIVFAEGLSVDCIRESIRQGRAVGGYDNKLFGDYRLLKYAYFLQRRYYAEHDRLRQQLSTAMLRYASAQPGVDSEMAQKLKEVRPSELFATLRAPV